VPGPDGPWGVDPLLVAGPTTLGQATLCLGWRTLRGPDLAPRKLGKARERRIVGSLKPFRWNPAGNQSTAVNIFEKQRNLLWANYLKQLITCFNYNSILMHMLFCIVNANLIVKMRDMGKDQVAPDHPDNPSSRC